MKTEEKVRFEPIPEKDLPEFAKLALRAARRSGRKLRAEHRRLGMPLIGFENGKVVLRDP